MAKKPKIIVRDIPSKMKVTEIAEEPAAEEAGEEPYEEESLESIAIDAPSAREFPELARAQVPGQPEQPTREESAAATPAATTEAESRGGVRYEVQRNVTEGEIRRAYDTRSAETREIAQRAAMITASPTAIRAAMIRNPEVEAIRAQSQETEKNYELTPEKEPETKRKKYPWEM